jgi:hypothetical protein
MTSKKKVPFIPFGIIGGGASGLYSAYRLATSLPQPKGKIALFEWSSERLGGRIFTKKFNTGQYIELGGMRFSSDHRAVNTVIAKLGLLPLVKSFPMTNNRLFYLRGVRVYENDIPAKGVPYSPRDPKYKNTVVDQLYADVSSGIAGSAPRTRAQWCSFFETATIPPGYNTSVYQVGDPVRNIGYWDLMYDQLGEEAFQYAADAGAYTSNVINWNAANALYYNGEFGTNVQYSRLDGGYSGLFDKIAADIGAIDTSIIRQGYRLVSFYFDKVSGYFNCTFINARSGQSEQFQIGSLILAMPRNSIELVAQNCPPDHPLRDRRVKLYLESVIEQPSYKVALLFNTDWWRTSEFPPDLTDPGPLNYGPSITDLPLRQVYYFGNNSSGGQPAYGLLASYDDMWYTRFWQEMELPIGESRSIPISEDYQPLGTGRRIPPRMMAMLKSQLNALHYSSPGKVPDPIEGYLMDWGLNPYQAGYHAWAARYSLCDAMQKIRKPSSLVGADLPFYIVGSAYSNDQAWVEGAFCTAESVLTEFMGLPPFFDTSDYPLICACA